MQSRHIFIFIPSSSLHFFLIFLLHQFSTSTQHAYTRAPPRSRLSQHRHSSEHFSFFIPIHESIYSMAHERNTKWKRTSVRYHAIPKQHTGRVPHQPQPPRFKLYCAPPTRWLYHLYTIVVGLLVRLLLSIEFRDWGGIRKPFDVEHRTYWWDWGRQKKKKRRRECRSTEGWPAAEGTQKKKAIAKERARKKKRIHFYWLHVIFRIYYTQQRNPSSQSYFGLYFFFFFSTHHLHFIIS